MKNILTLSFIFFLQNSFATNYYVNSLSGGDANSGTSTGSAWQTLSKVNSYAASPGFSAGDVIYFNRGQNWTGTLTISNSGSSGNPVTFDAYGTGANPIIYGMQTISTGWTNTSGNLWQTTSAITSLSTCTMLIINGINTPMGRWPNTTTGYLPYQSFSGSTSITSSSLGATNWTGAQVVLRKANWVIDVGNVTSNSGTTLVYSGGSTYSGIANQGFFIQNDIRCVDSTNEWYFDPATKKITIYHTADPSSDVISVPIQTNCLAVSGSGYYAFNNINFIGSNDNNVSITGTANVVMNGDSVMYSGKEGIYYTPTNSLTITNSTITEASDNGIYNTQSSATVIISNTSISKCGMIPGVGKSGDNGYSGAEIQSTKLSMSYCNVSYIGAHGIAFNGGSVKYNYVDHAIQIKQDDGAIYTSHSVSTDTIKYNIITNTGKILTSKDGYGYYSGNEGIYSDQYSTGGYVDHNSIINTFGHGVQFSCPDSVVFTNNTVYNAGFQPSLFNGWAFYFYTDTTGGRGSLNFPSNFRVTGNILFANGNYPTTYESEIYYILQNRPGSLSSALGNIDSNWLVNPFEQNHLIYISLNPYASGGGYTNTFYSASTWSSTFGHDIHSHTTPKLMTDTSLIQYYINPTTSPVTISLPYNYMDGKGSTYNGSITLQPYTSAILMQNGAIIPSGGQLKFKGKLKKGP